MPNVTISIDKVLSEDLGDGQMIRGVTIENPLRDS